MVAGGSGMYGNAARSASGGALAAAAIAAVEVAGEGSAMSGNTAALDGAWGG